MGLVVGGGLVIRVLSPKGERAPKLSLPCWLERAPGNVLVG